MLYFVITAGSGSGDSQQKKIKNLQKDLDYQREKVMELEKELKMVRKFSGRCCCFQTPALFFQYTGLNSAFVLSSSGVLTQNHIFSFKLQADRDAREKDKELTYALEKQRKYENVSSAD